MKKKYFVHFSYKKLLPASQQLTEKQLTFEIIELQPIKDGEVAPDLAPSVTTDGVLLALAKKGYMYEVNVLLMNAL